MMGVGGDARDGVDGSDCVEVGCCGRIPTRVRWAHDARKMCAGRVARVKRCFGGGSEVGRGEREREEIGAHTQSRGDTLTAEKGQGLDARGARNRGTWRWGRQT